MTAQTAQRFQTSDAVRMFPTFVWKAALAPAAYGPLNHTIMRTHAELGAPHVDLKPG